MAVRRRYYKELRINQLRALLEISRCSGFTEAAKSLDLAPPTVWQQIRSIEQAFHTSLVTVRGHQVELTPDGHLLVDLSRPLVEGFDSLQQRFVEYAGSKLRLSVVAPNDILAFELIPAIREFRKHWPDLDLRLVDSPSNPGRQLLENGEVDLAVIGQLTKDVPSSLACEHATEFPFMLVTQNTHALAKLESISLADLASYPLIMPTTGTNSRMRIDEVFAQASLHKKLKIAIQASTKELVLEYVRMDFGAAIAPISRRFLESFDSHQGDSDIVFRDLSRLFGFEQIVILRRRSAYEPKHQTFFRQSVLDQLCSANDAGECS